MPAAASAETVVFIPGLTCTGAVFGPQINSLKERPIILAETCDLDTIEAMAQRLLDHAPAKFALLGISMGGYIALEVIRQAPERVSRLALLNTNARDDTLAQTQLRQTQMAIVKKGASTRSPPCSTPNSSTLPAMTTLHFGKSFSTWPMKSARKVS